MLSETIGSQNREQRWLLLKIVSIVLIFWL